ncbi:Heme ABC transporter, cell surface heme and hemoprotein receptor HmuT [Euzebya pacifica]|uniref:Heme ABC transporter, cell surface heme and hemoprotein receptor HmuT n=1 Tax=Euzebya pacifica TaxID=1608957 RepID=A0A346XUR6_9ACTN|nr:ABC transporter substrate-binding protein [Euzebya pacifica]AXV05963.1 Heme ABC transporter, cell surface heme and hemoprotein receptor HmuT [Euzebya pacifica]
MTRWLCAALAILALLTGCSSGTSSQPLADAAADATEPGRDVPLVDEPLPVMPAPTPQLPVTVESADGPTVEVADVSRILPLSGGVAEVVYSLGLGQAMVGRDEQATFAEVADLPVVTDAHSVSAESVLSLQPTVVIGDTLTGPPEALDAIRGAGVPVVLVPEAWTLEDIYPRIQAVADALGVTGAGAELIDATRQRVDAAGAQPLEPAPTVAFLYLRGTAGVYLLGGDGSGADALIEAAGGIDAGSALGLAPFTPLTSEALVSAAPDVLLIMSRGLESVGGMDGLAEVPGIAQTPAGASGDVIVVDDGLLLSFGARTPAVVEYLAGQLQGWAAP